MELLRERLNEVDGTPHNSPEIPLIMDQLAVQMINVIRKLRMDYLSSRNPLLEENPHFDLIGFMLIDDLTLVSIKTAAPEKYQLTLDQMFAPYPGNRYVSREVYPRGVEGVRVQEWKTTPGLGLRVDMHPLKMHILNNTLPKARPIHPDSFRMAQQGKLT